MSKKTNMDCMNNMGKILLAIFFTNILAAASAQTTIHQFSIQQCLDYAKKNSVQVKNALLDLEIQQQTNKSITAGALPTIIATGTTTDFFQTPVTLIPGGLFPGTVPGEYTAVS